MSELQERVGVVGEEGGEDGHVAFQDDFRARWPHDRRPPSSFIKQLMDHGFFHLSHSASYRYCGAFQEAFTVFDTISPPLASSSRRQSRTQLLCPTVYRGLQLPETLSHLQVRCGGLSVPSNRTTRIESPSSLFANRNRWTIASTGEL
jgi:hypothetical protein